MLLPHVIPADSVGCARAANVPRRVRSTFAVAALLATVACALASSPAAADACPSLDTSYTGNCGPQFAVPSWTDAGGWDDLSQYSTIALADVNGDGQDELIGRSDAGVQINRFDKNLGQWRPQVDANGVPQLLSDFHSEPPSSEADPHNFNQPQYYSTIQAANVDGQPGDEILARFWNGMRAYKYSPPAGGGVDGGTWTLIDWEGPFSDLAGYDDASLYSTIQVVQLKQGQPMLVARQHGTSGNTPAMAFYSWGDAGWTQVPLIFSARDPDLQFDFSDVNLCSLPRCYLTLQGSNLAPGARDAADDTAELTGRGPSGFGALMWDIDAGGGWNLLDRNSISEAGVPPFGDRTGRDRPADCPFSDAGATGSGSGDCVGRSPSYYETFQATDIDGLPGDELIARASDGLRVKKWVLGPTGGSWNALPTLTALAGAASSVPDGMWGSIRTANIDGAGGDEVLFLDANGAGLQAWSYDPVQKAWNRLAASPGLRLGSDPWLTHPEYYSTIRTGDVDADGREDVIARGPYGIRTWFYNRRKTGGWERYLADGYPVFQGGQAAAFDALNAAYRNALRTSDAIRDVWTLENAPASGFSNALMANLASSQIGNCLSQSALAPPQYASCTPPQNSSGFTQDDWTAVVNEILAEAFGADQVVGFFSDLTSMRDDLFLQESLELPSINADLGLQVAAASTTNFDPQALTAGALGIAASVAGLIPDVGPELSAALWVASEATSMIPQTSSTATSSALPSTFAGLQSKFATMVSETDKGLKVMSQQVRQDASMLGLVSALRNGGPWASNHLDMVGIESAANQGFAIWAYRALMPTVFDRYDIRDCRDRFGDALNSCSGPSAGSGVIGGGTQNFTTIGPQLQPNSTPCTTNTLWTYELVGNSYIAVPTDVYSNCEFTTAPTDIMNNIWGPLSQTCDYVPGSTDTAWTFGDCSAGVDVRSSIGDNTWGFPTQTGDFDPEGTSMGPLGTGLAAQARGQAPVRLGRARYGRQRATRARAQLRAVVGLPRKLRLAGASIRVDRLLFERAGHGELTRLRGDRAPRPLSLRLAGARRFTGASKSGRARTRITLRRPRFGPATLALTSAARAFRAPLACHALPASIAIATPRLRLETRLIVGHGRTRHRIVLRHDMRCRRDAHGNVDGLEHVRYRRHQKRGGLALTLRGPRSVTPGATAAYVARVHNRRRGRGRNVSSLWDVIVRDGNLRTKRIRELRRGRTHAFSFTVSVPRNAGLARTGSTPAGQFCVKVGAGAAGTRGDRARACSLVRASARPRAICAAGAAAARVAPGGPAARPARIRAARC